MGEQQMIALLTIKEHIVRLATIVNGSKAVVELFAHRLTLMGARRTYQHGPIWTPF